MLTVDSLKCSLPVPCAINHDFTAHNWSNQILSMTDLSFMSTYVQACQGTKIFQYSSCPAGRVTYNFHSPCKHMHSSFKTICYKEHKGVICNITSSSISW